jgi:hypothetical protein
MGPKRKRKAEDKEAARDECETVFWSSLDRTGALIQGLLNLIGFGLIVGILADLPSIAFVD